MLGANISVHWTGDECWLKHITVDGSDEGTPFFNTDSGLVNTDCSKKEAMTPLVVPRSENSEDETQKWKRAHGAEAETGEGDV